MSDGTQKPASPAQRFGDYVVEKRLAMGGMAEIFLARHVGIEDFEKRVVLKRIRPELAVEPRFVRMFLNEARLAATLQHHHIAQVYDIGEDNGEYYFAMEYLDGVDARTMLRWGMTDTPIPESIALGIVLAVASGLHHAHEARDSSGALLGIVHRDISPSNIFVTYEGAIKLMDFGIAKAQFQEGAPVRARSRARRRTCHRSRSAATASICGAISSRSASCSLSSQPALGSFAARRSSRSFARS